MTGVTLSAVFSGLSLWLGWRDRCVLGGKVAPATTIKNAVGAQADGVDHHNVRKGAEVREHAEHPIEADAADADHGDEGGRERDTKAAQVA